MTAYIDLLRVFRALIDALNRAAASGLIDRETLKLIGLAQQTLHRAERESA